jgi:hypothetical protein
MRPDHFFRMAEAYHYNEEKSIIPIRRLSAIVANLLRGEDDKIIKETDIHWLSMFDKPEPPKITSAPIILTPEQIREKQIRAGIIKE